MATTAWTEPLPTTLRTVEGFEAWERQHAPEGSYEFVRRRIIEKDSMKQVEYFLIKFLTRLFATTAAYRQGDELTPEMDSYVDDFRKRRPDLAYFTSEQIEATRTGTWQSTRFAIEILSDPESHEDVLEKIQDYFDDGAVLVWYLVPKRRKIYVYTSPDELRVFKGTERISAAPLLPDFAFGVDEVFG